MKTFNYKTQKGNIKKVIDFNKFKNEKNILIQLFSSEDKKIVKNLLKDIEENLPNAIIIGSSSFAEIYDEEILSQSTQISISIFQKSTLTLSYSTNPNSHENAKELAYNIINKNSKLLILFTNESINPEEFLKGISSVSKDTLICGAVAGKINNNSFIISNNQILKNGSVGVSINSEELIIKNEYKFNWSVIGLDHAINKLEDYEIYEISNMKAFDFYKKYLGENSEENLEENNISFPLLVKRNNYFDVLKILKINKDGSLTVNRRLKINDKIKFGFANKEKLLKPLSTDYSNVQSFFIYSSEDRTKFLGNDAFIENNNYAKINTISGMISSYQYFYKNKAEFISHSQLIVGLSEDINHKNKTKNIKTIEASLNKNLKTLTKLMEESSYDYKAQTESLEVEKFNSQMLLTSQKIFLRHAVHETNTPISVIMSNVELYEMQYGKNLYLTNIEVALKNIFNIYDDLSYLVKKDEVEYPKKDMDIIDFIRARLEFFTQTALQVGSKFVFHSNTDSLVYNFNETKLQRIIDNNITNAIKYTNDNSNIYVDLFLDETKFIIDISSCSLYIQSPVRVFKEYYREESKKQGFGLGLSLVKKICDEENIKIILDSNEYFTSFKYLFKLEKK